MADRQSQIVATAATSETAVADALSFKVYACTMMPVVHAGPAYLLERADAALEMKPPTAREAPRNTSTLEGTEHKVRALATACTIGASMPIMLVQSCLENSVYPALGRKP